MAEIASSGGFDRDSAVKIQSVFKRLLSDTKPLKIEAKSQ